MVTPSGHGSALLAKWLAQPFFAFSNPGLDASANGIVAACLVGGNGRCSGHPDSRRCGRPQTCKPQRLSRKGYEEKVQ